MRVDSKDGEKAEHRTQGWSPWLRRYIVISTTFLLILSSVGAAVSTADAAVAGRSNGQQAALEHSADSNRATAMMAARCSGTVNASEVTTSSEDTLRARAEGRVGPVFVNMPGDYQDRFNVTSIAETFARVTNQIEFSSRTETTWVHIRPPEEMSSSGYAIDNRVYLRGEERFIWDGLMTHEYVHTRQFFDTTPQMEWLIEGSAFYYMALVPYNCGTMWWAEFESRIAPPETDVTLTENTSYGAAAERGAAVLAALDRNIRQKTNNTASLEEVMRSLNTQGVISYHDFQNTVATVAGEDMDEWMDEHIDGNGSIARPQRGQFEPIDEGPPLSADAGRDRTVEATTQITLNATGSTIPSDEDVSIIWRQTSGPNTILTDQDTLQPSLTAPEISSDRETLTFELELRGSDETSETDTVNITVVDEQSANAVSPLAAVAGDDCTVGFSDLLAGIDAYTTDTQLQNHEITFATILEAIDAYTTNTQVTDCIASDNMTDSTSAQEG